MSDSPTGRPVILVSLESTGARTAVVDAVARRYDRDYRILATNSARSATAELHDALRRRDDVALVLADDPSTDPSTGSVFAEARRLFPDVRRGLVIEWGAWADPATAQTVLRLMTSGQIEYYVVRPRYSSDESFHRSMSEFLLDWSRSAGGHRLTATVIGDDTQPHTHVLRAYLSRSGMPHRFLTPESPEAARLAAEAGMRYSGQPLVRLADGTMLHGPSITEVARAAGLAVDLPTDAVDLAIVGAGPGGLAAAVYAASEGLTTLVLERDAIGGQAGSSSLIRNYLGFSRGVSGAELSQRAYQQAWVFGARFAHTREVIGMRVDHDGFRLAVAPDEQVTARSVVLASGVTYRRLDVGALGAYEGTAVFYGASAIEAKAQTGHVVHVVGGGNSAGQAALHLARYAKSVSLIVREALAASMSRYLIDELDAAGVQILSGKKVVGGGGTPRLDHLVLRDRETGADATVPSDALFITIGAAPHTKWLADAILRDRWGSVITGGDVLAEGGRRAWPHERPPGPLESSVPGFFAVGDVRRGSLKRVASAVGEGSVVVSAVHAFLAERRPA